MSKTLSAGGDVDSWCTKCKRDALHNIVAMDADGILPVQVECRSCGGVHKYRPPKEDLKPGTKKVKAKTKAAAAKKAPARRTTKKEREEMAALQALRDQWTELAEDHAGATKKYIISETFEEGQAIQHKKFGLGFVTEVPAPNRVEILFEDGPRTLVAAHGS